MSQPTVKGIRPALLSLLSGILLALPFYDGRFWFFAWIGFVPLFSALQNKTPLRAFVLAYFCGIIFWSITVYWLIHVTLLGQILLILYLAVYFGIFGFIIHKLLTVDRSLWTIIFFPSAWVLLEYLRAHLLTGFGWALLGYSQYLNLPIIQIADLFGTYGVSFVVMAVNVAVYSAFSLQLSAFSKIRKCLVFVLIFSIILVYGYYQLSRKPKDESQKLLKISLIQGNIPQELKWAFGSRPLILDRYTQLTKEAALGKPDIIIWPEASSPGFLGGPPEDERILEYILALAEKIKTPLLFGSVVRENEEYFNSALLLNESGKIKNRYDKLHLVPFGEYIPLKKLFPFLEAIVPIGDFTAGKEYTLLQLSALSPQPSVQWGVLICFEDTIPEISLNFVRKGVDFLVNITNDAWFGNTSAPYQHLSASVFRAVENRVPVVRAANTGVSCFIDAQGRITAKVSGQGKDIFIPGIKTGYILLGKQSSLYRNTGDIFVLACLALAIFCGIIGKPKTKKTQYHKLQHLAK